MSDHFSPEDLKHLSDLEALRDRGVLSQEEFERARRRLAAGRPINMATEAKSPARRPIYANWGFLAAAGLVALLFGVWLLLARESNPRPEAVDLDNGLVLNETGALPGPELCASEAIYGQLRDKVFDRAIEQYQGEPGPLNSLRHAVGVRMQYPVLRDLYAQIRRTDCSGRLILDVPPAAQDEFNGATALQADVEYAIQTTPEGGSNVVEFGGSDVLVQRIVAAATLLAASQAAAADGGPAGSGGWPPLECGGELTNSEGLICENPDLLRQERALAERYSRLAETLPPADRPRLAESKRMFLQERSKCSDAECLTDLYDEEAAELDRLARTSIDIMEL